MKDNFKTFPKLVADPTTNEQNIIAWKKRIEKELQKICEKDCGFDECPPNCPCQLTPKEILGE